MFEQGVRTLTFRFDMNATADIADASQPRWLKEAEADKSAAVGYAAYHPDKPLWLQREEALLFARIALAGKIFKETPNLKSEYRTVSRQIATEQGTVTAKQADSTVWCRPLFDIYPQHMYIDPLSGALAVYVGSRNRIDAKLMRKRLDHAMFVMDMMLIELNTEANGSVSAMPDWVETPGIENGIGATAQIAEHSDWDFMELAFQKYPQEALHRAIMKDIRRKLDRIMAQKHSSQGNLASEIRSAFDSTISTVPLEDFTIDEHFYADSFYYIHTGMAYRELAQKLKTQRADFAKHLHKDLNTTQRRDALTLFDRMIDEYLPTR